MLDEAGLPAVWETRAMMPKAQDEYFIFKKPDSTKGSISICFKPDVAMKLCFRMSGYYHQVI